MRRLPPRVSRFFVRGALLTLLGGCGLTAFQLACGGKSSPPPQNQTPAQPAFAHVVLLVEENHSYSEVVGNSSMPYFNGLIPQYGLATQYFSNAHPSITDYFVLTTGLTETMNNTFSGVITDDDVVRELINAGKSWKAYAESIPSPGYLGNDVLPYVRRHNPFTYLTEVQTDKTQAANIVPFTQFAADLGNNALPQYAFIIPDVNDDAHNGTLAQADTWLQTNIAPLLSNTNFQKNGLLIITFDEGAQSDINHGGGQVATLIISSTAKKGFQSTTFYQHESICRLSLSALGLTQFPGQAASAPDMSEFFTGH